MANQYVSALDEIAAELAADLKRYDIRVDAGEHMIVWRNEATGVRPYSGSRECRRVLKRVIKKAKATHDKEWLEANQSKLL